MVDKSRFVNPYNFAPLPNIVSRREPSGHDGSAARDLYSGKITVRWQLETQLLLPQFDSGEHHWLVDGRLRVPGSSMKGALRSLHETLFAGCLRVFDGEFLPGYRDVVASKRAEDGWRLAVVTETRAGVPLTVRLCEPKVVWVDAAELRRAYRRSRTCSEDLPRSADVITLDGSEQAGVNVRAEMITIHSAGRVRQPDPTQPNPATGISRLATSLRDGERVVLVTAVRDLRRRNDRKAGRRFWAVGAIGPETASVDAKAVERFVRACEGADDRRRLLAQTDDRWQASTSYETVTWWQQPGSQDNRTMPVGQRARVTGFLHPGDVIWARIDHSKVSDVGLAEVWRHVGSGNAKGRVPDAVLPCSTPSVDGGPRASAQGLCLSCEVFGSADAIGDDSGRGWQTSYAGHVRIGAAVSTTRVATEGEFDLAPLGTPHPGAGMFYLEDRQLPAERPQGDLPSQWGSTLDPVSGVRMLRGRKFFWHTDPNAQATFWRQQLAKNRVEPRFRARKHQLRDEAGAERQMTRKAKLVAAGTELVQVITVDGITEVGLRSLLAALTPGRLLDPTGMRRLAGHIGGGKPFGLGSATATIDSVDVTPARKRYVGDDPTEPQPAWLDTTAERSLFAARAGESFDTAHAALARLLDLNGLVGWQHHVSYPLGAGWDQVGGKPFDESFQFFRRNRGESIAGAPQGWQPLPTIPDDLDAPFDPTLPAVDR